MTVRSGTTLCGLGSVVVGTVTVVGAVTVVVACSLLRDASVEFVVLGPDCIAETVGGVFTVGLSG